MTGARSAILVRHLLEAEGVGVPCEYTLHRASRPRAADQTDKATIVPLVLTLPTAILQGTAMSRPFGGYVPPVSIENPILESPFAEPTRHLQFDVAGITSEIARRRRSTNFHSGRHAQDEGGAQLSPPGNWFGEWTTDADFVDRVCEHVGVAWADSHVLSRARAVTERTSAARADAEQPLRTGRGLRVRQ